MLMAARDLVNDHTHFSVGIGRRGMIFDKGDDGGLEAVFLDQHGVVLVDMPGMNAKAAQRSGCCHVSSSLLNARDGKMDSILQKCLEGAIGRSDVFAATEEAAMTIVELMNEWRETRDRIAAHIDAIGFGSRIYLVGDPSADATELSLAKLKAWQQEIDELMIDWLMPE